MAQCHNLQFLVWEKKIETSESELSSTFLLTAGSHKVLNLMPRPTQKAAKAKLQRKNAKNTFTSPQYDSDSGSVYNPSLICYIYCYSFFSGYRNVSDGKFATVKRIVPKCLDMCNTLTIQQFFRTVWCYIDAYLCILVFCI